MMSKFCKKHKAIGDQAYGDPPKKKRKISYCNTICSKTYFVANDKEEEMQDIDIGIMKQSNVTRDETKKQRKQEDMYDGEEEEEDIDVCNLLENSKKQQIEMQTFGIGNVLSNIVSYLPFNDIMKMRGINLLLNSQLLCKFKCDKRDIYFCYSNKYIMDILKYQLCNKLEQFIAFHFESMNLQCEFEIKTRTQAAGEGTNNESKSGLTRKYVTTLNKEHDFKAKKINPFKYLYDNVKMAYKEICDGKGCHDNVIKMFKIGRFRACSEMLQDLLNKDSKNNNIIHEFIDNKLGDDEKLFKFYLDNIRERKWFDNFELLFVKRNESIPGIFHILCLFLRRDLLIEYIHHQNIEYACKAFSFVIQPQHFVEYNKKIKNFMFTLNDQEKMQFKFIEK